MIKNFKLKKQYINNQSGQIFFLALAALGIVVFTVLSIIAGAQLYYQNSSYSLNSEKATAIAEAGIDKALASLNETGGSYNGESEVFFGDGSYSSTVTDKDAGIKVLQVTGYIPNKIESKVKRTITIQVSKGVGISFVYGMQVGNGGLEMGDGATFNGSIYANGSITGGNSSIFTGDVWVAAGEALIDQQSDCFGVNCQDYIFGKSIDGQNRQDVAQSFKPSDSGALNKVSLKLKKVGYPVNAVVRIMRDASGEPDKNEVLATGTLSANLVTSEYSFIDVAFDTMPILVDGDTYWLMVHAQSLDSSNYWVWSNDLAQGYTRGIPAWSSDWQAGSPSWNAITGDLGFVTYISGAGMSVNLSNGSRIDGDVHANTIIGKITVVKDAYYQNLDPSTTVQGTKYPGSTDPPPINFPISDANIIAWKDQAEAGGITNGNIYSGNSCTMTLGPGKIVGNVFLGNDCNITIVSPVWITGTLNVGNSTEFSLDQSFGAASGMIIVDGRSVLGNGVNFLGSDTSGSYLMFLSTYNSIVSGQGAIVLGNGSINGILFAPYGGVELANGASFKEIMAWKINLGNASTLDYQTGLAQVFFTSGPSGSFSLIKGTYQTN
ncbi:hypothetical protein KKE78_00425 [Patescibacteria group bacterium]|nr:hypothetical protein [Patescibacteria group bacterium]